MSNGWGDFTGTPGPWRITKGYGEIAAFVLGDGEDEGIADVVTSMADANLIAAAPDLLEALMEQLEDRFDEDGHYSAEHLFYRCMECYEGAEDDKDAIKHAPDCSVGKASAAISKALGGAS